MPNLVRRLCLGTCTILFVIPAGGCEHSDTKQVRQRVARLVGTSPYAWDDDKPRKELLEQEGVACEGRHVVAWFSVAAAAKSPALAEPERRVIVDRLDRGVAAAKRFIGKPNWSFCDDSRVYFYFPDANFISHAPGGNTVYIPLWRIREDKAPWLHEAMHILLEADGEDWLAQPGEFAAARMPLWLQEGLADALAMEISAREGLAYYSPLIDVPAEKLDEFAASQVRSCPDSNRLLAYIGGRGKMPELFGERRVEYAVAFYAASASFVRFIAKQHGYPSLIEAVLKFDHEHEELERLMGESLISVKQSWLRAIAYQL